MTNIAKPKVEIKSENGLTVTVQDLSKELWVKDPLTEEIFISNTNDLQQAGTPDHFISLVPETFQAGINLNPELLESNRQIFTILDNDEVIGPDSENPVPPGNYILNSDTGEFPFKLIRVSQIEETSGLRLILWIDFLFFESETISNVTSFEGQSYYPLQVVQESEQIIQVKAHDTEELFDINNQKIPQGYYAVNQINEGQSQLLPIIKDYIFLDETKDFSVLNDSFGNYTIIIEKELDSGQYLVGVQDDAGNRNEISNQENQEIFTVDVDTPVFDGSVSLGNDDKGRFLNDNITNVKNPTLKFKKKQA